MADHLPGEPALNALNMAVWNPRPSPGLVLTPTMVGSTPPSPTANGSNEAGIVGSMGTVGDALDNAVPESFRATLQTKLLDRQSWLTRRALQSAVFQYTEVFSNRRCRHSALSYLSPDEFERVLPREHWTELYCSLPVD